jgi:proteic killer suppression protein
MLDGVIQSSGDADTELVWRRERVRRFGSDLQRMANRKLLIIDAAETLNDLRVPPGNRLERLRGDRAGQYSIRINDQWRICFTWTAAGAADVEITDYH